MLPQTLRHQSKCYIGEMSGDLRTEMHREAVREIQNFSFDFLSNVERKRILLEKNDELKRSDKEQVRKNQKQVFKKNIHSLSRSETKVANNG